MQGIGRQPADHNMSWDQVAHTLAQREAGQVWRMIVADQMVPAAPE